MINLKPHPWLPDRTSYGDKPSCDNCRWQDACVKDGRGKSGWVCGSWQEAEAVQIKMEVAEE